MKILLAEDDRAMQRIVKLYLEKAGHNVSVVEDGEKALNTLYSSHFDLAILDWMMPKKSGIEVCKEIKKVSHFTKVLLLTAKSTTKDEIIALESGADDYIRKPFEPAILLLRVEKLLQNTVKLKYKTIVFDPQAHLFTMDSIPVSLSPTEESLIFLLLTHQKQVLTRQQLLDIVWGYDYEGDPRTLDTHIKRLREKIGKDIITTHHGIGYSLGAR